MQDLLFSEEGAGGGEIARNGELGPNSDVFTMEQIDSKVSTSPFTMDRIDSEKTPFRGVRESYIPKPLPSEVAIERNLLRIPVSVANAKAAKVREFAYKLKAIQEDGQWFVPIVKLVSGGDCPLPLPQHAKVLDVLLALFSNNFNFEGEVWFTFKEISSYLSASQTDSTVIKEAIRRYVYINFHFYKSWVDQPKRRTIEGMRVIDRTDLFDKDKDQNPRNSRNRKDLHYVKFSPAIIQSVQSKQIRLFPRDAFSELDAWSYMLYKIFYAPTDKEPVRRTVTFIGNFVGWSSGMPRLRRWIEKHLVILKEKKFVLWWQVKDDCYEVQANAAKYRKDDGFLTAKDPMLAEASYASRIMATKSRGKLNGQKTDAQTKDADFRAKATLKANKPIKTPSAPILDAATNILGQIARMNSTQLNVLAAFLNSVPEKERNELLMQRMVMLAAIS